MSRKLITLSVVAVIVALGFCNTFAESVRAYDNCNCCGVGYCDDDCAATSVVALTYPEPYNGEEVKKGGLTIQVRPVPPRPAPYWPRWVPVRPAPPPRPIGPPPRPVWPPRPVGPPPRW